MINKLEISGFKGVDKGYDLWPLTAVVGEMAEGKSAILEALQLALTGEIDGIGVQTLVDYLSPPETNIQATGDGFLGTYTVPFEDGKPRIQKAQWGHHGFDPSKALPVLGLSRLVSGGPPLEAAVLRRFGTGVLELPAGPAKVVEKYWTDATDEPLMSVSGGGAFLVWAKREVAGMGRRAGQAERKAGAVEVPASDAAELVGLEAKLRKWDAAVEKHGDQWMKAYVPRASVEEAKKHHLAAKEAVKEVERLQAARAIHESVLKMAQLAIQHGSAGMKCPLCGEGALDPPEVAASRAKSLALVDVKLAKARAKIAVAKRAKKEAFDRHRPSFEKWQSRIRELSKTASAQALQTDWLQEAIDIRNKQTELQNAARAVKAVLEGNRKDAYKQATARVKELALSEVEVMLRPDGPKWMVRTRGGLRWGSLSGSQKSAVSLVAPLVFGGAEDTGPRIVLLDDLDLAGYSAAGVEQLLEAFAGLVQDGVVTQVIATRHPDRASEIPADYKIIEI